MKITKKDMQLSMALIGILAVGLSYFFVFTKLQEKTELLKAEIATLSQEVSWLEVIYMNKASYEAEAKKTETMTNDIISRYEAGHIRQDDILYLYNMEMTPSNGMIVNVINMADPEEIPDLTANVFQTNSPLTEGQAVATEGQPAEEPAQQPVVAPSATEQPILTALTEAALPIVMPPTSQYALSQEGDGISMYKVPLTYNFKITYNGLKSAMDYIYSVAGRKSVEAVSLTFDAATGALSGNMQLNRYFLTGTGKEYQPEVAPMVMSGVDNIFRTIDSELIRETQTEDVEENQEEAE